MDRRWLAEHPGTKSSSQTKLRQLSSPMRCPIQDERGGEMPHTVDTLKHSDRARQHLTPPGFHTTYPAECGESRRWAPWQVSLALALILISGLWFWWLGPWQSGTGGKRGNEPASSTQPLEVTKEATASRDDASPVKGGGPERQRRNGNLNQQMTLHAPGALRNESSAGTIPANAHISHSEARSTALGDLASRIPAAYFDKESRSEAVSLEAKITDSSKSPATAGESRNRPDAASEAAPDETPASGELLEFKELPSRIQDAIALSISMVVYSKNADERRMTINGSTMPEGQEVSAGLKLETISPDGGIFSYQGYRFHKAARGK
jgi:hypothetical protein